MIVLRKSGLIALTTVLLLTAGFKFHLQRLENRPASDVLIEQLPMQIGEWSGKDTQGLDVRSQEILQLDRFVKRRYTRADGKSVVIYIGYWKKQTGDYQAAKHSPALCLPSNGWSVEFENPKEFSAANELSALTAKRLRGEVKGRSYLFYYWFFTGENTYSEEWQALIRISFQNFFAGRSDGGIIEITAPLKAGLGKRAATEASSEIVEDFLKALRPELTKIIARG